MSDQAAEQNAARPPGRPRSAASHQAILMATLELIAENGMRGMSMDAVAHRAGVSKATIYRRWKSKEEMVGELLDSLVDIVQLQDTGDAREDLLSSGRGAEATGQSMAKLIPALLGESVVNPEFRQIFHEKLLQPRRAQVRAMIEHGIDTGDIRPDVDVDLLADVMFGTVTFRIQLSGGQIGVLTDTQAKVWDLIVEAYGTPKAKRALTRRRNSGG